MKKILGLDLGTTSIGWALVNEAENNDEQSSIIKIGVRVNPLTVDEQRNFEQGKSITTNADRTLKRSMRHNLQRYKLRRDNLLDCLKKNGLITNTSFLCETGNKTTFQTYRLRAKAATENVSLNEFARVLLMINKKRGYKSNRRAKSTDEGQLIDGMSVAMQLYENNQTPGQLVLSLLSQGKKYIPEFYRSDLWDEFDRIWEFQQQFYPEILTTDFREQIKGKGKLSTVKIFREKYQIYTADNKGKDKRLQAYQWRVDALSKQLTMEEVAFVIGELNASIDNSSGYLGAISDRSKELYFKKLSVGQFLMKELDKNPNCSLKNQVFYRQDYLDEFEAIWETQAKYHPELTKELKKEIRDIVIFYQRPLKSQKNTVNFCEFESRQVEVNIDGKLKVKTVGCKVCPKSSPLFQEFKIWQILNNLKVKEITSNSLRFLVQEEKNILFNELSIKEKLSKTAALKLLFKNYKNWDLNREEIEGNRTQAALFKAYQSIIAMTGNGEYDFSKMSASQIKGTVETIFKRLGYNVDILRFDSEVEGKAFDKQPLYRLWHLLYSYEGDKSSTGNENLINKIVELTGLEKVYASVLANVNFHSEYGSLSTKAMRKILPFMKNGNEYSVACEFAGYRHSKRSLTQKELKEKNYKDHLELLPRNSLRNPVVEKILNQMINVVNSIVDTYGKPDEIRIELARTLKNNAKDRAKMTEALNKTTAENLKCRQILQKEFGLTHVSRNDIIRYKLYLELKDNGYRTLYSNIYIPQEKLFSKEFDIEHIIPQAKLFDDSFSNKTLECRSINIEKGNFTAYDYISNKYDEKEVSEYKARVENLYKKGRITTTKYKKLLMTENNIPEDFIERDLRDSQYIARKAREILEDLVSFVVPTTGSITDRLREDWQLVNVMQELNWDKYDKLGLTEIIEAKDGRKIGRIKDWSKRNDHRHHAMDALTIAFTKRSFIQYLNNLNAKSDNSNNENSIRSKGLSRDKHGNLKFDPPIKPIEVFRAEVKRQLENILVSIKAKNKVVTQNVNKTKAQKGYNKKIQLTPRGQLHNETVYGRIKRYVVKWEKIGAGFDAQQIAKVTNKSYRDALYDRLATFDNDPKKAFSGKNSLDKNPIYLDELQTQQLPTKVKIMTFETVYTIRKPISPAIKIDKVIDVKIRHILDERLMEFGGDCNKAFSNLEENPIWLNKEKGISIKRVTITGVNNAIPLHDKKDHKGKFILDVDGIKQPVDYVSTGNNHHVAIYRDRKGELQENIVSFYEATACAALGLPVVNKNFKESEGWKFLFSMKQNEYFVFPNEKTGFYPNEIDLRDPDNYALISSNLFRVQKITTKDYMFRHHLETVVEDKKELKEITWKRVLSLKNLEGIVKVRVNHIGQIVSVGEY